MARGWESKGVESQIEERQQPERRSRDRESPEVREREHKRSGLQTSRRRILGELERTRSETHRTALQNALAFLDEELKKLG